VIGPPQLAEAREADVAVALVFGLEDRPARVGVLGRVHRHVGVAQQLVGRAPVMGPERDADAAFDVDRHAVELERVFERRPQPGGDRHGVLEAGRARQEDRELVSAEAGELVAVAQHRAHAPGGLAQEGVAVVVAQRVVDVLEAIEVDQQQRGRRTAVVERGLEPDEAVEQPAPVRQAP
jgi:hypothetical protein